MKRILLYSAFILVIQVSYSQPTIEWQKCYGGTGIDFPQCLQLTSDGGYIIAGYTYSVNGDVQGNHDSTGLTSDFWILKIDSTSAIQWSKCYGGSMDDIAYWIALTDDGGYIIAGMTFSSDGDVLLQNGGNDYWIVKTDSVGNIQWQKSFGGTSNEAARYIEEIDGDGFIVVGSSSSTDGNVTGNHGSEDVWVLKLNGIGNIDWRKCLGGSANDEGFSATRTSDGGYIISCRTASNDGDVSGNHGMMDYWIVKLDMQGTIQWQNCFGGTNDESGWHRSIAHTSNFYSAIGATFSNNGNVSGNHSSAEDVWLAGFDSVGTLIAQKCLGGTRRDYGTDIANCNDGGMIIAGGTYSNNGDVLGNHNISEPDFWLAKMDSSYNLEWQKCLGSIYTEVATSIKQTIDSGFIVAGCTVAPYDTGDVSGSHGTLADDFWIVKLRPVPVGTKEIELLSSQIAIYPNPTNSIINLESRSLRLEEISIFNMFGGLVYRSSVDTNNLSIEVENFEPGFYYVQISTKSGIAMKPFVKM